MTDSVQSGYVSITIGVAEAASAAARITGTVQVPEGSQAANYVTQVFEAFIARFASHE